MRIFAHFWFWETRERRGGLSIEERSGAVTFGDKHTLWDYHVSLHEMSLLYLYTNASSVGSYLSLRQSGLIRAPLGSFWVNWGHLGSLGGDWDALGLTWVRILANVFILYMQNDGCILTRPSVAQIIIAARCQVRTCHVILFLSIIMSSASPRKLID